VKLRKPTKRNFDYFWKKFGVFPQTVVGSKPKKIKKKKTKTEQRNSKITEYQRSTIRYFYLKDIFE